MNLKISKPICFFDLETTGVNVSLDRIVEISILKIFPNATQSVLGYYNRLNTGTKFKDFREVRQKVELGKLPATELLNTLTDYSELEGDEYKIRLESIISHNKLDQYDNIKIC